MVTHNTALCLPRASHVVCMEYGKIAMQGTPANVVASGILGDSELLRSSLSNPASRLPSALPSRTPSFVGTVQQNGERPNGEGSGNVIKDTGKILKKSGDEAKTEGSVDWNVYKLYLQAMGSWWFWILVILTFGLQQLGTMSGSLWIREW